MKLDTGFEDPYSTMMDRPSPAKASKSKKSEPKIDYPSFTIQGEAGEQLVHKVEAGQEIVATVKLRVTDLEIRKRETADGENAPWDGDRTAVGFDILSIDIPSLKDGAGDDESAEDAVDGFLKEKGLGRK